MGSTEAAQDSPSARAEHRGKIGRFRDDAARERFRAAYDNAVASWPIPPTHLDVETGYGPTHVLSSGSGTGAPIVLLHGVAVSSPSWFASVGALSETHPVFAIDAIGDAGRSTQTSPVRTGDDMSRWLDEVLAALGLDRVHLIGLSYGGWLALNQASRSSDRLVSVTAVDPIGAIGRPSLAFMIKIVPDSVLALAKSEKAIHRLLRRLNNGTPPEQPLLDLSVTGLRSYVGKQPFPKRLTDDDLRAIHTPTLVLFGEQSPVNRARRAAERSRDLIANVEIEVVPDAGHMLPVERPGLFTSRVLGFIDEIDALSSGDTGIR
jgi:pimeloyl-ACP methyl ester carboxylesterase